MSGKIALDTDVAIKFLNGDETINNFLSKFNKIYMFFGYTLFNEQKNICSWNFGNNGRFFILVQFWKFL